MRDRRGIALIEFSLVMPILIIMLFGIIMYGSWIALSHAVQQSANEAARASIAGLTLAERATLAQGAAVSVLARSYNIDPASVTVRIDDDGATLVADVSYDASANPLLSLPVVPRPPRIIERQAAVKLNTL